MRDVDKTQNLSRVRGTPEHLTSGVRYSSAGDLCAGGGGGELKGKRDWDDPCDRCLPKGGGMQIGDQWGKIQRGHYVFVQPSSENFAQLKKRLQTLKKEFREGWITLRGIVALEKSTLWDGGT